MLVPVCAGGVVFLDVCFAYVALAELLLVIAAGTDKCPPPSFSVRRSLFVMAVAKVSFSFVFGVT